MEIDDISAVYHLGERLFTAKIPGDEQDPGDQETS
jgi:hypothetical protein